MIGGGGEKLTLRVVAEYADWWNLPGATLDAYAHKFSILARHCAAVDRPFQEIRKTWMEVVSLANTHSQAVDHMENYPTWPGDAPLVGTPSEIISQLQAYQALVIDLFILAFTDEPEFIGVSHFINHILPEFQN
jgi:alkanesulfonate monooxygenase SsuD/methylene tetrahydromethanopterin reductase-like flavin-dependent oxidoreductase (luciferase family)